MKFFRRMFGSGESPDREPPSQTNIPERVGPLRHSVEREIREVLDPELEGFPPELREIVLSLRHLTHQEYIQLVDHCKGRSSLADRVRVAGETSHLDMLINQLTARELSLDDVGVQLDILRLTRTERPNDGYNVLEKLPEAERTFSAASVLRCDCRMTRGASHFFTISPSPREPNISILTNDNGQNTSLRPGQTVTLGRGAMTLTSALGSDFAKERLASNDVNFAEEDSAMSRACIKVRRTTQGTIEILECGAVNVSAMIVTEQNQNIRRRTQYIPATGESIVQEMTAASDETKAV